MIIKQKAQSQIQFFPKGADFKVIYNVLREKLKLNPQGVWYVNINRIHRNQNEKSSPRILTPLILLPLVFPPPVTICVCFLNLILWGKKNPCFNALFHLPSKKQQAFRSTGCKRYIFTVYYVTFLYFLASFLFYHPSETK